MLKADPERAREYRELSTWIRGADVGTAAGSTAFLLEHFGLSADGIVKAVRELLTDAQQHSIARPRD